MPRGPAPTPTLLKLVRGNPGKRAVNTSEPIPPGGLIERPAWLDADPLACEEWARIVPTLCGTGIVRPLDAATVIQWCVTWSRFRKVAEFVREKGTTYPITNRRGVVVAVKEFPQAKEFRQLQGLLILLSREMGMTPSARSRIQSLTGGAKTADDLRARYLGGA